MNAKNGENKTALMFAVNDFGIGNAEGSFFRLLRHGAELDHQDNHGNTALIMASEHSRNDYVEALLHHGADANIKNNRGESALFYANSYEREMILLTLCDWPGVEELDRSIYCPMTYYDYDQ